ncbi:MAG: type II toxin-antitoxin system HicA family toxin [Oscillospiraceae bacterium]|nr:type II toxin-antitoxin system HicA family toxin [Oscillospiraceae bacterium]
MSKKAKMLARLRSKPKDFTFDEAKTILELCGYNMKTAGKTGGSRVSFDKGKSRIRMHKPHPRNELHQYVIAKLIDELKGED